MIEKSHQTAALLKVLAHPHRLMILCHLAQGEKTVTQLQELCGTSQSIISQFLTRMRSEQLVSCKRVDRFSFYRITDSRVTLLIRALNKITCR